MQVSVFFILRWILSCPLKLLFYVQGQKSRVPTDFPRKNYKIIGQFSNEIRDILAQLQNTANGVDLLTEIYVIYIETHTSCPNFESPQGEKIQGNLLLHPHIGQAKSQDLQDAVDTTKNLFRMQSPTTDMPYFKGGLQCTCTLFLP